MNKYEASHHPAMSCVCVKYIGSCRLYWSAALRICNEELNKNLQQEELDKI